MYTDWLCFVGLSALFIAAQALPAGLGDEAKKTAEQPGTRPKVLVKRSQELLMFGNQQNQRTAEQIGKNKQSSSSSLVGGNAASPSAEKRTLSNSGLLEDVSSALSDKAEQQQQKQQQQQEVNRPKALPSTYAADQSVPQHEKNYEYGRILVNELDDVIPRNPWDESPSVYGRYYGGLSADDRRKRSGEPSSTNNAAVNGGSDTSATDSASQIAQPKRSIPSYYQEFRYKRESDVDPDKQLMALLSLYNSDHRNRGNWRNYGNDEYDGIDDDTNVIGLDDEDPNGAWLDNYPQQQQQRQQQQQQHYLPSEPLLNSELAALARARSLGYYDQYQQPQQQQQQQYDNTGGVQYGTPQYGLPYGVHGSYYPSEKRFMVSRKRAQNYDSYNGRNNNGYVLNTRSYPGYQHRLLY